MMEQRNKRGAFIVFEGLDRSGKTTQVDRLLQSIDEMKESYPHLGMRFPGKANLSHRIQQHRKEN